MRPARRPSVTQMTSQPLKVLVLYAGLHETASSSEERTDKSHCSWLACLVPLPTLSHSLSFPFSASSPSCLPPPSFFCFYLARTRTQQTKRTQAASEAGLELAIFLPALHKCWVTGWASTQGFRARLSELKIRKSPSDTMKQYT